MASTTSGSPQRPKTPVPVPSSPFVSPTRTKVSSPSNISRKNALIRPTSPDTFLEASQQLDDSPSHPKFERTGTERLAGPANRLLGGPTRLYIGNAKRPQSPNPKNLKEVPPDTPNLPNIFKIGEAERAAFKAASSPPHPAVSFSVEASGKPHRNRPQLTVTGVQEQDEDQDVQPASPNSSIPANPSPDSMLGLLHGRRASSATSLHSSRRLRETSQPISGLQASSKPAAATKKRSWTDLLSRRKSPEASAAAVEEKDPQIALKLFRNPSTSTLQTTLSEPQGQQPHVDDASALPLRSVVSSPAPPQLISENPRVQFLAPLDGALPPADPRKVLSRSQAPSADNSPQLGTKSSSSVDKIEADGMVRVSSVTESATDRVQGRVLLSWGRTKERLPPHFNEGHARRTHIAMEKWRECFLVVHGKELEIYTSHHVADRVRHRKLLERIPLESSTKLSLFSPADYTMIVTVPEVSRRKALINRLKSASSKPTKRLKQLRKEQQEEEEKEKAAGFDFKHRSSAVSAIFAIRAECPSMAQDFFWHIWRALGNELPTKLEASLPSLGAKLMIRLPQSYEEAKSINPDFEEPTSSVDPMYWSSLTPEAFVQTIQNAVSTVPEWQEIAENAAERGLNPVLAWRRGNYLEWVRHEHTVSKQARPWSLVAGLAMAQHSFSMKDGLEMRLASPYPMTADLPEGPMQEPAYPEGDCVRLHGVGSRDQIYLFSLGPHLFVLPIQYAWKAPEPLAEHQGKPQVQHLASTGFFYKVGKAFSWNGPRHEAQREDNETDDTSFSKSFAQIRERGRQLEETERERSLHNVRTARGFLDFRDIERVTIENPSDQVRAVLDDPRSLEGLVEQNSASMQENNPVVLEITLGNGRQMRNEWTNVNEALVWVYRLRQLARYWQARTAADARHGLGSDINGDAFGRICSQTRGGKEIIKDPSPTGQDAFLNLVYNWSIITGSRYYTLSGSVYIKDERRTQYVRRHCIIVKGHLFFYKVHPFRYSTKSTQHIWHPIKSHWDLNDSYVISQGALCSGWNVATDDLDYKPGEHFGPRVYADGLRSADEDEDCSLAIWKRLNPSDLSKKAKVLIIRCRSKMERDQWAFALDNEIERLVRQKRATE